MVRGQHAPVGASTTCEMDRDAVRRWEGGDVDLTRRLPSDLILAAAERDPGIGPATWATSPCWTCRRAWTRWSRSPARSTDGMAAAVHSRPQSSRAAGRRGRGPEGGRRRRGVGARASGLTVAPAQARCSRSRPPERRGPPTWGPAGEEAQRLMRRRPRLGGVGDQCLARVRGQGQALEGEGEIADDRWWKCLVPVVSSGRVRGPQRAERVAAGGQLADELGQDPVVGVAARLGAQQRHAVPGGLVPVGVEVGRPRIEKGEPGVVRRLSGDRVRSGLVVQVAYRARARAFAAMTSSRRSARTPGRRSSRPAVAARRDARAAAPGVARPGAALGCAGQAEQVGTFGLVELQVRGRAPPARRPTSPGVAALESRVVLDAHAGEQCGLLAAQAGDAPMAAVAGQAGLLRLTLPRREIRKSRSSCRLSTRQG